MKEKNDIPKIGQTIEIGLMTPEECLDAWFEVEALVDFVEEIQTDPCLDFSISAGKVNHKKLEDFFMDSIKVGEKDYEKFRKEYFEPANCCRLNYLKD